MNKIAIPITKTYPEGTSIPSSPDSIREKLKAYLASPRAYQQELRHLSRSLYEASALYRGLIQQRSAQIDLMSRSVIPLTAPDTQSAPEALLARYARTLEQLEAMDLPHEFYKLYVTAWLEDAAYGCVYNDGGGFFIRLLDGDFCRIGAVRPDSSLAFACDMSWFETQPGLLEEYGGPFPEMWEAYQTDPAAGRWQEMPVEYSICLKVRTEDPDHVVPPYLSLFPVLLDLEELRWLEASNARLARRPVLLTENSPDRSLQWQADPALIQDSLQDLLQKLPEAAFCPLPLHYLKMDSQEDNIITMLEQFYLTSGDSLSQTDCPDRQAAFLTLLPQTEHWLNSFLSRSIPDAARVRFLRVSGAERERLKQSLREETALGLPNLLTLNALNGFTALETLSLKYLEQDCLHLNAGTSPAPSGSGPSSGG